MTTDTAELVERLFASDEASALTNEAGRAIERLTKERMAPVQGFAFGIPWSIHVEAWDVYAARYGRQQTAERLAERGGFGTSELDVFIPGWRERVSELRTVKAERDAAQAKLAEAVKILELVAVPLGGNWGHKARTFLATMEPEDTP